MVVVGWICFCSIPLFLATLYLMWSGMWLVLGVLLVAVIAGQCVRLPDLGLQVVMAWSALAALPAVEWHCGWCWGQGWTLLLCPLLSEGPLSEVPLYLLSFSLLADQLFQRIARETEIAKTSSAYGLNSQKRNGTANPTRNCVDNHSPNNHSPLNSSKKAD